MDGSNFAQSELKQLYEEVKSEFQEVDAKDQQAEDLNGYAKVGDKCDTVLQESICKKARDSLIAQLHKVIQKLNT